MSLRKHWNILFLAIMAALCLSGSTAVIADETYGSGSYGSCQFQTCSIGITSNGTVNLNVTPSGTKCTVASDTVGVTTDSSTGYTLTLSDTDTVKRLADGNGNFINAIVGTAAAPVTLIANRWGYRVDGVSGFGAGPTSVRNSQNIPTFTFAALPLSTDVADTIATSNSPANPTVNTLVWFGVCASNITVSGTYTDNVTYTAVIN